MSSIVEALGQASNVIKATVSQPCFLMTQLCKFLYSWSVTGLQFMVISYY